MPAIRFPGLAKTSRGTSNTIISKITGYQVVRDGDDWIVPENDPKLLEGPSPVVKTEKKGIPLNRNNYSKIADLYINSYCIEYFEKKLSELGPIKITIPENYGEKSILDYHKMNFFFLNPKELKNKMIKDIFPFMEQKMGAKTVWPVKVDAEYQQGFLSLNKIALLINRYGIEKAEKLVLEIKALDSVLPKPIDFLNYMEALLTFSPYAVTLPFHRVGSNIHFFHNTLWVFPRLGLEGMYETILTLTAPLTEMRITEVLRGSDIGFHGSRMYFVLAVEGVNRISIYLNNPLNFINDKGVIEHQQIIQNYTAINLMMTDLLCLNFTNSPYIKQRVTFEYIDKLSNMKKHLSKNNQNKSEGDIFKNIFSMEHGDKLAKIIKYHFSKKYEKLGLAMYNSTINAYSKIHERIKEALFDNGKLEGNRLEHLRCLRNTAHGPFLRREQFERAFFSSAATIPPEVIFLPLLLTWGLILETEKFLEL